MNHPTMPLQLYLKPWRTSLLLPLHDLVIDCWTNTPSTRVWESPKFLLQLKCFKRIERHISIYGRYSSKFWKRSKDQPTSLRDVISFVWDRKPWNIYTIKDDTFCQCCNITKYFLNNWFRWHVSVFTYTLTISVRINEYIWQIIWWWDITAVAYARKHVQIVTCQIFDSWCSYVFYNAHMLAKSWLTTAIPRPQIFDVWYMEWTLHS